MQKDKALKAVLIASKLFDFEDSILVEFKSADCFPNSNISAISKRNYSIWFNENILNSMNDLEICCTAFHEVRHIYQFVVLDFGVKLGNIFNVPATRKELWQFEINNYLVSRSEDDVDYLNQDIKIDAIAFSHYLMKELFEVTTVIPEIIIDKVLERVNEIQIKCNDKIYGMKLR